jgi:enolase
MTEPTSTSTFRAQSVKAAQCSVIALLENIKAAEYTTEAVKELFHGLSSINKALGRIASAFDQSDSCKISHEVQRRLQMAIWTNKDACARYQEAFKERTSPLINDSLRDSDWHPFDAFVDIQSQLLSERLQLLEDTINMVMEIYALYVYFKSSVFPITSH